MKMCVSFTKVLCKYMQDGSLVSINTNPLVIYRLYFVLLFYILSQLRVALVIG